MTILILHGIGGYAGKHWQQWLHDECVKLKHQVLMPTLTDADHPDRFMWLAEIQNLLSDVNLEELIIVGHSLGVVSGLDFIETCDEPIKALISVAGFYQDYGLELNSYFMQQKRLDIELVRRKIINSYVIYGDDDPYVPQLTLSDLTQALDAEEYIIENGGHVNTDKGFTTLPVVMDIINTNSR